MRAAAGPALPVPDSLHICRSFFLIVLTLAFLGLFLLLGFGKFRLMFSDARAKGRNCLAAAEAWIFARQRACRQSRYEAHERAVVAERQEQYRRRSSARLNKQGAASAEGAAD